MQPNLKLVRGLAFDIDETLSTKGKLTDEAFAALWDLKRAGFALVPITGRPAGWCDHIARFWPVDAVVGENGAFVCFMHDGKLSTIETPKGISLVESQKRLGDIWAGIQVEFPDARAASDQDFRKWDLAVDLCEDVPPWSDERVKALQEYVQRMGAHAKLSSIHLNIWLGDYTKSTGFQHWLAEACPGLKKPLPLAAWAFIGDSPNDEPSFELFPVSAGVANIKK
jgi:HAD superfamily hydrolase (TIGR01484 family)